LTASESPTKLAAIMFYGWRIVSVVFLTHFISVGLVFYSYGVFFKSLVTDFGGSRFGVATGLAVMNLAIAAVSPYLGRLVDRSSIRLIMCGGAFLMAIGFFAASRIEALWQFYLIMGTLLALGSVMLGALPGSTLVANWFSERRGIALGVAGMGISLSGLAMAPVATGLIASIGWRNTFVVFAAVTLVTVIPAVWWVIVNRPEEMGLVPDGGEVSSGAPEATELPEPALEHSSVVASPPSPAWSTREALREPNFWVIAVFVGLNFFANGAVLTHIIPHATDLGFEPLAAAWVLSTMAGFGVIGKLLFGWIVDRLPRRAALGLASGLQGIGVALVYSASEYPSLLLAGAVFGLGMGGIIPLWGATIGAGFGRHAFGRVMGLMTPVMVPIHIFGIPYAGWIYDRTGSYQIAFLTFLGAYALAMTATLFLRLPEVEPGAHARRSLINPASSSVESAL
jgi:MFS family permease